MKERADESRLRVNVGKVGLNTAAAGLVSAQRSLADALACEVVPDELIGIQLWRIARQEMQLQATGEPLDVLRDQRRTVRGMAVEDQQHRALAAAHEVRQQFDEPRGVEPLGVDLVPEFTAGGDGGDRTHTLTPAAGLDLGRLPPQSPGAPEDLVGADSSLVEEADRRADARGPGTQAGELRRFPALDCRRIALVRAPQRFLWRDVQLGEQSPDRRHAHPHPEPLLDQDRHNLAGPQAKVEAVLARVLTSDPSTDLELLSWQKRRLTPRMRARLESRLATTLRDLQPLVDCRATQPDALDDATWGFALLHPPNRQQADGFRGLVRQCASVNSHAPLYHGSIEKCSLKMRLISK